MYLGRVVTLEPNDPERGKLSVIATTIPKNISAHHQQRITEALLSSSVEVIGVAI